MSSTFFTDKVEICKRAVNGGEAVSKISREVGISENTLYEWVARYRENSKKPFVGIGHVKPEDEVYKKLQRENKELREENEISKNSFINLPDGSSISIVEVCKYYSDLFHHATLRTLAITGVPILKIEKSE